MDPYLIILGEEGRRLSLAGKQCWRIGRGADNDIVIDNQWISRHHAMFQCMDSGVVYLVDLGSQNGSLVNGQLVVAPAKLADGDQVMLGRVAVTFHSPRARGVSAATATADGSPPDGMNLLATATLRERRLMSVLVVDIRDFTVLSRTLDEHLLHEVIATFQARAGQVLRGTGSWPEKSTGDGLMAMWVHEGRDDAFSRLAAPDQGGGGGGRGEAETAAHDPQLVRVFTAVLAIADRAAALNGEFPLPFPLRIGVGVNTGYAMVGNAGRGDRPDYSPLGDTVNAAFRLESVTKQLGADVVIGEATHDRLLGLVDGPSPFARHVVNLKGYDVPQPAYACSFADLRTLLAAVEP